MAWTTNPTEATRASFAAFQAAHPGQRLTVLGSAFSNVGKRIEFYHCPTDNEINLNVTDAGRGTSAKPATNYVRYADFRQQHGGHSLTHLGHVTGPNGVMDCWYCQVDDACCFDTVT